MQGCAAVKCTVSDCGSRAVNIFQIRTVIKSSTADRQRVRIYRVEICLPLKCMVGNCSNRIIHAADRNRLRDFNGSILCGNPAAADFKMMIRCILRKIQCYICIALIRDIAGDSGSDCLYRIGTRSCFCDNGSGEQCSSVRMLRQCAERAGEQYEGSEK